MLGVPFRAVSAGFQHCLAVSRSDSEHPLKVAGKLQKRRKLQKTEVSDIYIFFKYIFFYIDIICIYI